MEDYTNELTETELERVIEVNVGKQISKDPVYQDNMEKAGRLLDRFKPNLSQEVVVLFEEYMDYIMNANERACTIAYLAGAKDKE